ncbi:hypothetical protein N7470_008055 [Penicillium chermesinum]|nr:hypothetical protein N7470_008055 [Penicillium chermesinum]
MTKILIFGATGYIGKQIANLLVQSGQYTVYGVARDEAKAQKLAQQEIIPVISEDPFANPEAVVSIVRNRHIDVVLDVATSPDTHKILTELSRIGAERLESYKRRGIQGPKLGFVYCSGTWVHGSSSTDLVNDLDPVGPLASRPPPALVAWRLELEDAILQASDSLDVMIVRPSLVYGREGAIWSSFFTPVLEAAKSGFEGSVEILLEEDSKPGLVHVDDVASGFVKAIEKLPWVAGARIYPVFNLVTSQESMRGIFDALAGCWGFKGKIELKGHGGEQVR